MSSSRSSLVLIAACASGADIALPGAALERDRQVTAVYRTNGLATGRGELSWKWTDSHGRVVDERTLAVELIDESEIAFPLDLRRAAAMKNTIEARFRFEGNNKRDAVDKRDETARIDFVARPPAGWRDYRIVMWQNYPAHQWTTLKTLGIDAGQYVGRNKAPAGFLFDNDLQWYAENNATDFYAEYHRYRPDRQGNWPFYQAKDLFRRDPSSKEAFKRRPSLSDPAWIAKVKERLVNIARDHSPYRPLFYDLGDESGIADLSAYWDFDFSDYALDHMRTWLRSRYGTLAALNKQWGSSFTAWEAVTPDTTIEAMKWADGNHSSWNDHKEFMDVAFADALEAGVKAVQSVDPGAYVGIAGAQMPGWGGYDYARLAKALTFFEPYDIGNNIEIIRSLAPETPVVTTSFATGPWEKHRVWYEMLHGNRGMIIWDDKKGFVAEDGSVGARGAEVRSYYNELRNGTGMLFANARRLSDPIAIHYSQASMRTAWMRQHQPKGDAWLRRTASTERLDSDFLRLRESYCRLIEDAGLQYDFVSYGEVEQGRLLRGGYRALILPDSNSLSEAEAAAIREFAARGGTIVSATAPGEYDEHGRKLPEPRLAGVPMTKFEGGILDYHRDRVAGKESAAANAARKAFERMGLVPAVRVDSGSGVETHTFRFGDVTLIALHTNPQLRVDELGPPDFKSNQRFERVRELKVRLPRESHVYDVRRGKALGRVAALDVTLDPYEPRVFALSPRALEEPAIAAPREAARGSIVEFGARTPGPARVYHIEILDPERKLARHYSGNFRESWRWPIAMNDATGQWTVAIREIVSGWSRVFPVTVR